jgi:KipI family sensor histidine kinase inhibitor
VTGEITWRRVGDRALLRTLPGSDVADANRAARALYRSLAARRFDEVVDLVPGARSVLVVLAEGVEPSEDLIGALSEPEAVEGTAPGRRLHTIPVTYDGPDLADVARSARLGVHETIELHAAAEYIVAFIGFAPGFPYLLGLDDRLATPRLDSPRTRVPAGSVGIADRWTGIYPRATPGGWRLIGRTEVELFDAAAERPSVLEPGDRVRFVPR